MFLGDIVKVKENTTRPNNIKDNEWLKMAKEEEWLWLIVSMDSEDLDYVIRPIYVEPESNSTELGEYISVLYDEIEKVEISRKELFKKYNELNCRFL